MYPGEILNLFPPFPRTNMVFVAMSFDSIFDFRWEKVIKPAIANISINEKPLIPHRVDLSKKSDSIITEIVKNISECRLVFADISTIGCYLDSSECQRFIRNSNVLYEVGIAHASRLTEEVILIRSDRDKIDFDISGVRVHDYNPETNLEESYNKIQELINNSLKSINDRRQIAVERAARSLDYTMYTLLQESIRPIAHPPIVNVRDVLANTEKVNAINRLLSGGLFQAKFKTLTRELLDVPANELIEYSATAFGRSVLSKIREDTNFASFISEYFQTQEGRQALKAFSDGKEK